MRLAERLCLTPSGLLWLAVPLVVERMLLWEMVPERHMLTSDWSNHSMLFVAYTYGYILAGSPWLGRAIDEQWRTTLVVAVTGTVLLSGAAWTGLIPARLPPSSGIEYFAFWALYSLCAWTWMVGLIGFARRWLNRESGFVRYGNRTAYAFYILHQPIIVAVAYVVVKAALPTGWKFAIILIVSAGATIAGVELLRRFGISGGRRCADRPTVSAMST